MRTKHQAKKLAKQLTAAGIPAVDLHGNLSQAARDRNLAAFSADRRGGVRVLVATDVAARGVHVDDVELVVHVDPPIEHKAYLHRSGRTARAGAAGDVVTVDDPEQRRDVADLLRKAGITAPLEQVGAESAADHRARRRARRVREAGPRAGTAAAALVQAPCGSGRPGQRARTARAQGRGRGNASGSTGRGGAAGSARGGDRNATAASGGSRPMYSTGTGQPSHAHNPRPAQAARPTGSRRAQHNGTRSGAPRG